MKNRILNFDDYVLNEYRTFSSGEDKIKFQVGEGEKSIILVPGAGGNPESDFDVLIPDLSPDYKVWTIEIPNEMKVREFAEEVKDEIKSKGIKNFALAGYSVGAGIVWHIAKKIEEDEDLKGDFSNKIFFIDGGIPETLEKWIESMRGGNPEKSAIATPSDLFIKGREQNLTDEEANRIQNFFVNDLEKLGRWKETHKGKYLDYTGDKVVPPSKELEEILSKSPEIKYILEDKVDPIGFEVRYSYFDQHHKNGSYSDGFDPLGAKISDLYKEEYDRFYKEDSAKKEGIGMDGLTPLESTKILSILAGVDGENPKSKTSIKGSSDEVKRSTKEKSPEPKVVPGFKHSNITRSPEVGEYIKSKFLSGDK